jgi:hypothetical protein
MALDAEPNSRKAGSANAAREKADIDAMDTAFAEGRNLWEREQAGPPLNACYAERRMGTKRTSTR